MQNGTGQTIREERSYLSFGRYLKAVRQQRNISLDYLAETTKINPRILAHIEADEIDKLPAPVYMKSYIQSISGIIGADEKAAEALYMEALETEKKSAPPTAGILNRWVYDGSILSALVFTASIIGLICLGLPGNEKDAQKTRISGRISSPKSMSDGTVTPAQNKPHPVLLSVIGTKPTTIELTIDDGAIKKYPIKAGDQLAFTAKNRYSVFIEDVSAVKLFVNGHPYRLQGKEGLAAEIHIP